MTYFAFAQTNKQKELKPENIPVMVRECLGARSSEQAFCKSQMFCTFCALKLFCSDMCRILCGIFECPNVSLNASLLCFLGLPDIRLHVSGSLVR